MGLVPVPDHPAASVIVDAVAIVAAASVIVDAVAIVDLGPDRLRTRLICGPGCIGSRVGLGPDRKDRFSAGPDGRHIIFGPGNAIFEPGSVIFGPGSIDALGARDQDRAGDAGLGRGAGSPFRCCSSLFFVRGSHQIPPVCPLVPNELRQACFY
jgi:hypothetical protein